MTLLEDARAVSAPTPATTGSHPTPCPAWCMHRGNAMAHNFGPTMTPHWGALAVLNGPFHGIDGKGNLLQVELYRGDTGGELAEPTLYVRESGDELPASEVDLLIARLKTFTAQVESLRAQMG